MDWSCILLPALLSYIFHDRNCRTNFDESFCWHTRHMRSDFFPRDSRLSQWCFALFISLLGSRFSLPSRAVQHSETSGTANPARNRNIVEDLNLLLLFSSLHIPFKFLLHNLPISIVRVCGHQVLRSFVCLFQYFLLRVFSTMWRRMLRPTTCNNVPH